MRERAGAVPGSGMATRVAALAQLVATASSVAVVAPVAVPTAVVVSAAMALAATTHFSRRRIAMPFLRRGAAFNPAHFLRPGLWLVALKRALLVVVVGGTLVHPLNGSTVIKACILFCGAWRPE